MSHGKLVLVLGTLATLFALQIPRPAQAVDEALVADEKLLRDNGVTPDGPGLLKFFRDRTLSDKDRENLISLVRQLGSSKYKLRVQARNKLIAAGTPSLPLLREALKDADLEINRLAARCIDKIEKGPGPALPAAAAHLLVKKKPAGSVGVLLNYLPYADDEWLEEEVLGCLGELAIQDGKVDPVLKAAVKDRAGARRGAAAYVLGRMGGVEYRDAVRQLLGDKDKWVRQRAAFGLVGKETFQSAEDKEGLSADETVLKEQKIATDGPGLLAYFQKRTLSADDQLRIKNLVRQLGHKSYKMRTQASTALAKLQTTALPFLRMGVADADLEIVSRAEKCIKAIEAGQAMQVPTAAVRLLQALAPEEALETLLGFIPFADDEAVEEEVLKAMLALSTRGPKVSSALVAALKDEMPTRRAAAAYVLGQVGSKTDCQAARKLVEDTDVRVSFRAAQGQIAAREKSAVEVLVQLLAKAPNATFAGKVEEALTAVADDRMPTISLGDGSREALTKASKAWDAWWQGQKDKVNLARLNQSESYQGLRVISEYGWNGRAQVGKVWACGKDGKERWSIDGLQGPMDGHLLPSGTVLIAENYIRKVSERDRANKKVLWEITLTGNPVSCQRLPNGNTFIACYYNVMEVRRDKTEVYNINRGPNEYIYSGQKLRNGNILLMTSMNQVVEITTKGKEIRRVPVQNWGNWSSAEGLKNGRYLVALMSQNKVVELDAKGTERASINVTGVNTATRLPNGNTLVTCMNHRLVAEYDRHGKKKWEKTTEGQPWRVHYR
jgi:HEAT repeat protein